jgi:hypothetical protein
MFTDNDKPFETPLAELEQSLIDDFIREAGYDAASLSQLTESERDQLRAQASIYASGKLTEAEARARILDTLQSGTSDEGE